MHYTVLYPVAVFVEYLLVHRLSDPQWGSELDLMFPAMNTRRGKGWNFTPPVENKCDEEQGYKQDSQRRWCCGRAENPVVNLQMFVVDLQIFAEFPYILSWNLQNPQFQTSRHTKSPVIPLSHVESSSRAMLMTVPPWFQANRCLIWAPN